MAKAEEAGVHRLNTKSENQTVEPGEPGEHWTRLASAVAQTDCLLYRGLPARGPFEVPTPRRLGNRRYGRLATCATAGKSPASRDPRRDQPVEASRAKIGASQDGFDLMIARFRTEI